MADFQKCDSCERPSNNQYFNCPPRMADGRHFTDYRPRCTVQYQDKVANRLQSSYEYREFLIHNANDLMLRNAASAYAANRCGPCMEPYDQGTMLNELEKQVCNSRTCSFVGYDAYGLGLGRDFGGDQGKKEFLQAKEAEQAYFKQAGDCCAPAETGLQTYFPLEEETQRYAVPGGGKPVNKA